MSSTAITNLEVQELLKKATLPCEAVSAEKNSFKIKFKTELECNILLSAFQRMGELNGTKSSAKMTGEKLDTLEVSAGEMRRLDTYLTKQRHDISGLVMKRKAFEAAQTLGVKLHPDWIPQAKQVGRFEVTDILREDAEQMLRKQQKEPKTPSPPPRR